jgi:hypothetical protein
MIEQKVIKGIGAVVLNLLRSPACLTLYISLSRLPKIGKRKEKDKGPANFSCGCLLT